MIKKFDILNHADYCGEFRHDDYIPGLLKFNAAIESIRSKNKNTLLLDAGDEINRLLWYGKTVFDGMKLLKTDCMCLGNHEFDRGKELLEENIEYIYKDIPILCSNITYKDNGQFIKNVEPYIILEKDGVRFGILGITTEYSEKMITYPNFEPFKMHSPIECAHKYIPILREKGADIIICLCHIGTSHDKDLNGELLEFYENTKDLSIDLIIGGHTPGDISEIRGNTIINKGGFSGKSLLHATLYYDDELGKVVNRETECIDVVKGDFELENKEISEFVDKTFAPFSDYFDDVFAYAKEEILMSYSYESALGDIFADAVRWKTGVDFTYFNTTSCGPRIPKGNITKYIIKQANYFNDSIYLSEMYGYEIKELFETVHNPEIYNKNCNLMFSGMIVTINHNNQYKSKVVSIKDLNGNEIDLDKKYKIATSQYMASGGNDTRKLAQSRQWQNTGMLIHDIYKDYLAYKKEVDNSIDNRYIFIGEPIY